MAAERIQLESDDAPEPVDIAADGGSATAVAGWGRYVAAVAHELDLLGRPAAGFAGRVTSNLPRGAGLSSSAALEVGVGSALCAVADFPLAPLDLAAACRRAEQRAVGVPCGIMDQAASVLGEDDRAIYLDCGTLEHAAFPLPSDLALVVIDSAVRHAHESSGYAQRREELEAALVALDGRRPADVDLATAEEGAAATGLDDLHWRRLRHVVTENARVRELAAVLRDEGAVDRDALGRIFLAGHVSLRDDYEVSTPELDWLVEAAYERGAVAARMTGGGFGGSVLALADVGAADELGARVRAEYAERFGLEATVRVCAAAAGARELS